MAEEEREETMAEETKEIQEDIAINEQSEGMDDRIFNKISELYDTIDKMQASIDDRFDRVWKIMLDSGAVVREYEQKQEPEEIYQTFEDLDFTI